MLSQMTVGSKLQIIFDEFFMCQYSLSRLFLLVYQVCYTMASPFSHFKEEQHSKCIQIFNDDSKVMKLGKVLDDILSYLSLQFEFSFVRTFLVARVFLRSYISCCTQLQLFQMDGELPVPLEADASRYPQCDCIEPLSCGQFKVNFISCV